jgi:hypothetical protein
LRLLDVIAALETNATDSDADGVPDVEELRAGTDPNALEGKLSACHRNPKRDVPSARPRRGTSLWTFGAALVLGLLAKTRRQRVRSCYDGHG